VLASSARALSRQRFAATYVTAQHNGTPSGVQSSEKRGRNRVFCRKNGTAIGNGKVSYIYQYLDEKIYDISDVLIDISIRIDNIGRVRAKTFTKMYTYTFFLAEYLYW
jgi:hypothetical protein